MQTLGQLSVVPARKADLEQILAIQYAAYQAEAKLYDDYGIPPLRQTLRELEAESHHKLVLKAVSGEQITGSVRVQLIQGVCYLGRLVVAPDRQGCGIGSALLRAGEVAFPQADCVELFTGSRSVSNLRFYEKRGYRRLREEVLSPKVTLVFLRKPLKDTGRPLS
jgi:ribosomal protein S18 acetylase RimI-like enzyme